jgi:transposase-like protein
MAERGVTVDRVSIYRWVQRFTPATCTNAKFPRTATSSRVLHISYSKA